MWGEQTQGRRWTSKALQDSGWKISIQADVCACLVLEDSGAQHFLPPSICIRSLSQECSFPSYLQRDPPGQIILSSYISILLLEDAIHFFHSINQNLPFDFISVM